MGKIGGFVIGGPTLSVGPVSLIHKDLIQVHVQELKKSAKERGAIFVSIETLEDEMAHLLDESGWSESRDRVKKFVEPYTRCVDLTQTQEDILMQMTEKGRYNVRYASKKGVTVTHEKLDARHLDAWYALLSETAQRDGFSLNPRSFFEALAQSRGDIMYFYTVSPLGHTISQAIFIGYGSVGYYYYGASSSDPADRKLQSTYLLQYEMMCYAQKQGYRLYDFLGIAPPQAKKHHLSGVSEFKAKFGGEVICYPSARVAVLTPLDMCCYIFARKLKHLWGYIKQ